MTDVLVRRAEVDELERVGELTVAAYRDSGYFTDETVSSYATSLADARARFDAAELLVAEVDGVVVGTVTLALHGGPYVEVAREGELEFRMLAVDTSARGRGVGEALVRAAITRAGELGLSRVVLCTWVVKTDVHRLYERLGFHRLPDRDWHPGPDVLLIAFGLAIDQKR